MYSYPPLSDLSVKILDLYMNIDLSVNMSFMSVNISDLSEHITVAHEHIRPVCEHIRLVCEHINWQINLPIHSPMPVLSLCLLFVFVASFAFIFSLIYSVIISLNPVERNVSINFEYLSINKNTSAWVVSYIRGIRSVVHNWILGLLVNNMFGSYWPVFSTNAIIIEIYSRRVWRCQRGKQNPHVDRLIVLNTTFSNILAISGRPVLVVEEAGVLGENHQATGKLYHLRLRVECTLFYNLQSRARTHTILLIGFYELLGNPTT